jgi:hypothetical protein
MFSLQDVQEGRAKSPAFVFVAVTPTAQKLPVPSPHREESASSILNLQTQLDSLADSHHEFIQRSGLRVASPQLGDARHIISLLIPVNYDAELPLASFSHKHYMPEAAHERNTPTR